MGGEREHLQTGPYSSALEGRRTTSPSMGSLAWPPRDPDPLPKDRHQAPGVHPRGGPRQRDRPFGTLQNKNTPEIWETGGYCFLQTYTLSQSTPLLRPCNWGWYCQKVGEGLPVILVSSKETPSPSLGYFLSVLLLPAQDKNRPSACLPAHWPACSLPSPRPTPASVLSPLPAVTERARVA